MLMRFDPFSELDRLSRQLLDTPTKQSLVPMDAWRRGDQFMVQMDMPGIDIDTLDVTVERNTLTVAAARRTSQREGDESLVTERPVGRFTRQLFLSDTLDVDGIQADYVDGVLTLSIPVADQAKPRRIEVRRDSEQQSQLTS